MGATTTANAGPRSRGWLFPCVWNKRSASPDDQGMYCIFYFIHHLHVKYRLEVRMKSVSHSQLWAGGFAFWDA
jgi:hypothetical protein